MHVPSRRQNVLGTSENVQRQQEAAEGVADHERGLQRAPMIVLGGVEYLGEPEAVYGESGGVREGVVEVDDKQPAGDGPV